jgi:hypothetical protein
MLNDSYGTAVAIQECMVGAASMGLTERSDTFRMGVLETVE